nr:MAG TPA: hypothetical protein [Caudoviricetes sp.]
MIVYISQKRNEMVICSNYCFWAFWLSSACIGCMKIMIF